LREFANFLIGIFLPEYDKVMVGLFSSKNSNKLLGDLYE